MAAPMDASGSKGVVQAEEPLSSLNRWLSTEAKTVNDSAAPELSASPASQVAQAAIIILGGLDQAILMIGRNGAIWFQNESARRLMAVHSDVSNQNGLLACATDADQGRLNELIAALPWTTEDDPSTTRVLRFGNGPGALILVGRVITPAADSGARVGLIVLHRVEETEMRHTPSLLRQAFSLTRAEAAVATMIAGGNTPAEIASHRNVSVETIRAQLRVLYSKTRTNRQAELVRLVHRLTALG